MTIPRRRIKRIQGFLFLLPSLAGLALFYLIPFGISVGYSFSKVSGRFVYAGWDNYRKVLGSAAFRTAMGNTFLFLGIGIAGMLVLGYALTALMKSLSLRSPGWSSMGITGLLLPMVLPSGAMLLFVQVLVERYGVLNRLLTALGLSPQLFLQSSLSFWVLMIIYWWKNLGYIVTLLLAGLLSVPQSMVEAAQVDGAGKPAIFFKLTLPHLLPFFAIASVMSIVSAFKMYRESYQLMGLYPDQSVYMLQNFLNNNFEALNYQRLSSATVLFVAVLGVILYVLMRIALAERE